MTEISHSNSINVSINANRHKIIFVGDAGVGKTTLINRINGNAFQSTYDATIGVDFWPKVIKFKGNDITLQIWDTAGQEKYRGLIPSYIRNSSIVFIVFDITNRKTFESIPKWIELITNIEKNKLVLVGNKEDLVDNREVKKEEGEQLAKNKEMSYYELSAKEKNNIKIKKSFYDAIIDLPIFNGYNENREKLVNELIQENQKDYVNLNLKKSMNEINKKQKENDNVNYRECSNSGYCMNNSDSFQEISNVKSDNDSKKVKGRCFC